MKVICEGLDLSDAVMKVVKACSTKTTNPILECIKISAKNDGLTLVSTGRARSPYRKKSTRKFSKKATSPFPESIFPTLIKKLENVRSPFPPTGTN